MALTQAEVTELVSHPQLLALADELELSKNSMISDLAWLQQQCGALGRAVAEVAQARRSAAAKLPAEWIFSAEAGQQATPLLVALQRAQRLRDHGVTTVADVTCSIGTEVAALNQGGIAAVGADIDRARLAMAAHNVPDGSFVLADATAPALSAPVVVADPARRAQGRRLSDPSQLLPPLPDLIAAWRGSELAIKSAPGLDFSDWEGEVELTSVSGSVKEACLYTPGLAATRQDRQVRRSAVLIDNVDKRRPLDLAAARVRRYDDTMDDDCGVAEVGRYIVDPDGAVVRAGLVRHFAAAHRLWQLDERIAHLSGDDLAPGLSGFPVIETVALKKVRARLAALDCGAVEILVRGVDVNPDVLRKQWRLRGSRALAVVVTRIGKSAVAVVCGPREWAPS